MSLVDVTIGLGSNLDEPVKQVQTALASLASLAHCRLIRHSSLYISKAMTLDNTSVQPDYINAVALLETSLDARALLTQLQAIENQQGRVRTERWGARTLDLDILTFGDQQIKQPDLQIPHVGIAQRSFVLIPLHAIMGDAFFIPGLANLADLVKQCPDDDLEKLEHEPN